MFDDNVPYCDDGRLSVDVATIWYLLLYVVFRIASNEKERRRIVLLCKKEQKQKNAWNDNNKKANSVCLRTDKNGRGFLTPFDSSMVKGLSISVRDFQTYWKGIDSYVKKDFEWCCYLLILAGFPHSIE